MAHISKKPHNTFLRINRFFLLGTIFVLTGISILVYGAFEPAPKLTIPITNTHSLKLPYAIQIQGLTEEISVLPGHLKQGEWDLSTNTAMYLVESARPNQGGNTVIYGHNTAQVFKALKKVKTGAIIIIKTDDKKTYQYVVDSVQILRSDHVEILKPTNDARITLFTCKGLFDSLRLVVVGKRA